MRTDYPMPDNRMFTTLIKNEEGQSLCGHEGCSNPVFKPRHTQCGACRVLRSKYGITAPQRDAMIASQNGLCSICKATMTTAAKMTKGKATDAVVDHCHATGKVRGILCRRCNATLGLVDDKVDRLQSSIDYLQRFL